MMNPQSDCMLCRYINNTFSFYVCTYVCILSLQIHDTAVLSQLYSSKKILKNPFLLRRPVREKLKFPLSDWWAHVQLGFYNILFVYKFSVIISNWVPYQTSIYTVLFKCKTGVSREFLETQVVLPEIIIFFLQILFNLAPVVTFSFL